MSDHDPKLPWRILTERSVVCIVDKEGESVLPPVTGNDVMHRNLRRIIAAVNATQHETIDDLAMGVTYRKLLNIKSKIKHGQVK